MVGAGRAAVLMQPELGGLGPGSFPACRLLARLALRWWWSIARAGILGGVVHGFVQPHRVGGVFVRRSVILVIALILES